jgi:hypothetical protein
MLFDASASSKTTVWHVTNKQSGAFLGTIKWSGGFRKYAYFPHDSTMYEENCLEDIATFLQYLTKQHRLTSRAPANVRNRTSV